MKILLQPACLVLERKKGLPRLNVLTRVFQRGRLLFPSFYFFRVTCTQSHACLFTHFATWGGYAGTDSINI